MVHTVQRVLYRWSALGALLFIALIVGGTAVLSTPLTDAPAEEWTQFLADDGNRAKSIAAMYLFVVAAFAFLWFAWGLVSRLHAAVPESTPLVGLTLIAAALFAGAILVAAVALGNAAASITFGGSPTPEEPLYGEIARVTEQFGFGVFFLAGLMSAAVTIALVSTLAWDSGVLPRWISWLGYVTAVALLFAALFFPLVMLAVWLLSVGVYQLTHEYPRQSPEVSTPIEPLARGTA